MLEEMMRKAMQDSEKRKEATKPAFDALWPENEGDAATDASINFTFNSIADYVFGLTEPGEKQVQAMKALREACTATKAALREELKNNKFPGASWFRRLVPLREPEDDDK